MPIYVFKCPDCGAVAEELRPVAEIDAPGPTCPRSQDHMQGGLTLMARVPTTASFAFMTKGGNVASFSGAAGPVTRGNRRPKVISRGNGLGGHRPVASPKHDPEFRAALVKKISGERTP